MKKTLLVFTGYPENKPKMPFAVVVLASYLRKYNIPVEILDTRVQPYNNINFDNYSLIGISAKSGEQLSSAVEVCTFIRKVSKTPIVMGGPHATFFPEQTCKSPLVDFVIKGEGEKTLYELITTLNKNKKFEKIKGLTYKKDNKIISNPEREFLDMEELDIPAYDLINLNKYQDKFHCFTIETSRGCPYRCDFCYVHEFHKRKWRAKSIKQSINEIKEAIKKYNIKHFMICDDNFYVLKKRVLDFSKEIIKKNLKVEFLAFARANYFANYSDEELALIRKSGFKFIGIGAESGSQKVLDIIHKDITCEDILNSAKNCIRHGMIPVYSFIIGTPGETKEDLNKTIDMFFKIKKISPKVEVNGFFIFTPYSGTPIYSEAVKRGYKPFNTLEGWASWRFSDLSNNPWIKKRNRKKLQIISNIIQFWFLKDRFKSYGPNFKRKKMSSWYLNMLWNIGSPLLFLDAKFRLKNRFFILGYEWLLFGYIASKFKT